MNNLIVPNNVQDRDTVAWKKLCAYVDELAESGAQKFSPREALGDELFADIFTLPESIRTLKKVTKIWLYGSNLKRIPPEIGEMESLEYFDPYTSYDLNWFPYELTRCRKLKDSRISTRALYGNYKHRSPFPSLDGSPVKYDGDNLKCSVCTKAIGYDETEQHWVSLKIGTDVVPLLTNTCSEKCKSQLLVPPENYVQKPHKGGPNLLQPPDAEHGWKM